ncbi:MAG: hypothetical protein ABW046_18445 [Actinoplanes sp.]
MPEGTTLARLVDEFVATLRQHGIAIDRPAVEREMRERIAEIAERLGVDPETVLREHAQDGWGHTMATDVTDQIRADQLLDRGADVAHDRTRA